MTAPTAHAEPSTVNVSGAWRFRGYRRFRRRVPAKNQNTTPCIRDGFAGIAGRCLPKKVKTTSTSRSGQVPPVSRVLSVNR